jgi:hypothetical protein
MTTITDCRLSFIWNETILDSVTGALSADHAPLPQALGQFSYVGWFDRVQRLRSDSAAPAPPWPTHARDGFWRWYLGAPASLAGVSGAQAWRNCVPVRVASPVGVSFEDERVRVRSEGVAYPWGVALIVNLVFANGWSDFDAATTELVDTYRERRFTLDGQALALEAVGDAGLAALCDMVFGAGRRGRRTREPFSVFTVARGAGSPPELDPHDHESIHRFIQATSSFSPTWEWDELIKLEDASVGGFKQRPTSHVMLGTSRGRSVWAPAYFSQGSGRHTLSCRHRNLVMASTQTDSLAAFADATVVRLDGGSGLGGVHDVLARRAMQSLGGLYLGARSSFRSMSPKRQLDDSGMLPAVNLLRAGFNASELIP